VARDTPRRLPLPRSLLSSGVAVRATWLRAFARRCHPLKDPLPGRQGRVELRRFRCRGRDRLRRIGMASEKSMRRAHRSPS